MSENNDTRPKTDTPEGKTPKPAGLGLFTIVAGAVVAFMIVGHLGTFLFSSITEGWANAGKKSPVGYLLFGIVAVIAYFAAIPALRKRGFNGVANGMLAVMLLVAAVFVGEVAGCGPKSDRECEEGKYGTVCR